MAATACSSVPGTQPASDAGGAGRSMGTGGNGTGTGGTTSIAGSQTSAGTTSSVGGGSTAGTGSGGTGAGGASSAGTSSSAGAAGKGGLDPASIPCDYTNIMVMDCAHAGCHAPLPAPAAELDLTPNSGLAKRLKDVAAKHLQINCAPPGEDIMECTTVPAACPSDVLLVNSANWEASWIISKLRGTQTGCGDTMRDQTYLTDKPNREACVESVVKAIAALPK